MANKQFTSKYRKARWLVILYTILLLLMGLVTVIAGAVVFSRREQYTNLTHEYLYLPSALMICTGFFILFCAVIGIIGIFTNCLLGIQVFFAVLVIMFFGQLSVGVFAYITREHAGINFKNDLTIQLNQYAAPGVDAELEEMADQSASLDDLQQQLACCGSTSYMDWREVLFYDCGDNGEVCGVPDSCCKYPKMGCGKNVFKMNEYSGKLKERIHSAGCAHELKLFVIHQLDIIGGISLGFSIPQLLGVSLAYFVITQLKDSKYMYRVELSE